MKLIFILLFTLTAHAEFKAEFSSNLDNPTGQHFTEDTEQKVKDRLIKIAKMRKGWRKGEWNKTESKLSEAIEECNSVDTGETQTVQDMEGNDIVVPVYETVCADVNYYYHPSNWSYTITDITAEMQAKKDKEIADKAREDELKAKDMKLDELIELLKLKGVI